MVFFRSGGIVLLIAYNEASSTEMRMNLHLYPIAIQYDSIFSRYCHHYWVM